MYGSGRPFCNQDEHAKITKKNFYGIEENHASDELKNFEEEKNINNHNNHVFQKVGFMRKSH